MEAAWHTAWGLAAAVALAVALACAAPGAAWAAADDDAADAGRVSERDDNVINTQQMPDSSFLYDSSIYDLVNADLSYDGTIVRVTGEVVGDAIADTDSAGRVWVTLASTDPDREGTIAVLMDADDLALVDTFGGYNRTGTTLQVQGTFNLACSTHAGTTDIHATRVSATAAGSTSEDPLELRDFAPGMVLLFCALLLMALYRFLRERRR